MQSNLTACQTFRTHEVKDVVFFMPGGKQGILLVELVTIIPAELNQSSRTGTGKCQSLCSGPVETRPTPESKYDLNYSYLKVYNTPLLLTCCE